MSALPAGQHGEQVADGYAAGLNLSLKAAEAGVGAADALNRQDKAVPGPGGLDLERLQILQQGRALVPGHMGGGNGEVVALRSRDGDDEHMVKIQVDRELPDLFGDARELFLPVLQQIHLVDGEAEIPDAHQSADPGVAPGLGEDAFRGVEQDDRGVGEGGGNGHVACILLVPRRICHDEAALFGGEVTVGNVDGDALLTLGHQAVEQKRVVQQPVPAADPAFKLQRTLLIREEQLGVIEHMPDQGGLAVVHAAAGHKLEQIVHIRNTLPACVFPCWPSRRPCRSRGWSAPR